MEKKAYHHGNLQTELIEEGLALIHEQGIGSFSLRKLVKRIGVSPTACYNHFATVDDLLGEMQNYVTKKFCDTLTEAVKEKDLRMATLYMGKAYVRFFSDNPHYFSFMYDNENYNIRLTETEFDGDYEPFRIFKEISEKSMEANHIPQEKYHDRLLLMWATVHGLAAMANMKGFHYEGDWESLVERIMCE
ncbi:TetR/AcrR family transcriptional regulator [Anaerosporobacter faecicola]|uniref:TetR/AcrR family transcriptional regulator n=1 Tax=Anaerosporobacter faecicola TaxID=2718714 RepID=UPI00143B0107|nr:TetR/AcrR family transcriptional regulator [Anaerosporobacter faecicola]